MAKGRRDTGGDCIHRHYAGIFFSPAFCRLDNLLSGMEFHESVQLYLARIAYALPGPESDERGNYYGHKAYTLRDLILLCRDSTGVYIRQVL